MNNKEFYKYVFRNLEDIYKLKEQPKSLTEMQILSCLKYFLEKDENTGWITIKSMKHIIRTSLKFKTSEKELEQMLKDDYPELNQSYEANIDEEKINFNIFISMIDMLKREKLVLVQLLNSLNYFIFFLLVIIMVAYIAIFYDYKTNLSINIS